MRKNLKLVALSCVLVLSLTASAYKKAILTY